MLTEHGVRWRVGNTIKNMDYTKCKIKYVKIAENNVEKQWVVYGENKTDEIIVKTESYGLNKLVNEKNGLLARKDTINNYDKIEKLAKVDAKLAILDEIERLLIPQSKKK